MRSFIHFLMNPRDWGGNYAFWCCYYLTLPFLSVSFSFSLSLFFRFRSNPRIYRRTQKNTRFGCSNDLQSLWNINKNPSCHHRSLPYPIFTRWCGIWYGKHEVENVCKVQSYVWQLYFTSEFLFSFSSLLTKTTNWKMPDATNAPAALFPPSEIARSLATTNTNGTRIYSMLIRNLCGRWPLSRRHRQPWRQSLNKWRHRQMATATKQPNRTE